MTNFHKIHSGGDEMFELYDVALVPLILGVVEVFKRVGLPAKFSPLVAMFLGIALGIFYLDVAAKEGIIIGLALGLSASGLYSGTKNMIEKEENNDD